MRYNPVENLRKTMEDTWRIITSPPANGAWNMAVDEAILMEIGAGRSLPTLRLYAWNPPCLSLGYAQSSRDANLEALIKNGWTLVRRPTGGRAILHIDELTYSVIAPPGDPRVTGSVLESYRRLSKALLSALNSLGLEAQADPHTEVSQTGSGPVCFEVPSNYEITVEGKKLIGSAQARRREGILQHGSLPLSGDLTRIIRVLQFQKENEDLQASSRLLEHATTVETILRRLITFEQAADAFRRAFEKELGLFFLPGDISPLEHRIADELVKKKYANPKWTLRMQ